MYMDSGVSGNVLYNQNNGDSLGIHDPSEIEFGGVGHDNQGQFARKSKKILRGLVLMIIVALCWVGTIHLFRLSFHRERLLVALKQNSGSNNNNSHALAQTSPSPNGLAYTDLFGNQSMMMMSSAIPSLSSPFPTTTKILEQKSKRTNLPKQQKNSEYPSSNFDAPYFITWYCTIWNVFFLPVYMVIHVCIMNHQSKSSNNSSNNAESNQTTGDSAGSSAISNNPFGSNTSNKSSKDNNSSNNTGRESNDTSVKKVFIESIQGLVERGFTMGQFFWRCAFFCTLCMLANYMMIFSLRILDATVVMSLVSTTVSLIYLLSWVVLHQQFVGIRIVGIIVVDTGVALLVYMDGVQHQTLAIVMIAFGSAIVYSVYKVFMRRMIGYTTFSQMSLFHSLIGLLSIFLAWPLILLLLVTGVETIVWQHIPWLYITGASVCFFLAQILASFCVICTYEVFLTLGILFAIPISAVIDIYINSVVFRDMKLGGVLLIIIGFLVVLLPDNWNIYLTNLLRNRLKKWTQKSEKKKSGIRVQNQDVATGHLSRLRSGSGRVVVLSSGRVK